MLCRQMPRPAAASSFLQFRQQRHPGTTTAFGARQVRTSILHIANIVFTRFAHISTSSFISLEDVTAELPALSLIEDQGQEQRFVSIP
jgi:hypothetical protein